MHEQVLDRILSSQMTALADDLSKCELDVIWNVSSSKPEVEITTFSLKSLFTLVTEGTEQL